MNERIKELAEQAHLVADATYAKGPDSIWEREYNKKFVELIVKECARVLDDKLSNPNGASMAWCDGSDLLKHFGVKE